jgi:PEP-CTERM motif
MRKIGQIFFVGLLFSTSAQAQIAGQSRPITVTFNGVVTNSATDTIRIRQADGTTTNYTGPLPDFPYKDGDQVSISFNTTVPTAAYYAYTGQTAADGIYRIGLTGPGNSGGVFGRVSTVSLPTGTRLTDNSGQPFGIGKLSLIYNANTDSYSMDFGTPSAPNVPANGTATIGLLDGAGLSYNPTTQTIARTNSTCVGGSAAGCSNGGPGGYVFTLSGDSVSANNIPVFGPDPNGVGGPLSAILGLFDFGFTGSWNLPTFGASNPGGPIDVPEPSMLLLFGGGVAALMRRRRKATAT